MMCFRVNMATYTAIDTPSTILDNLIVDVYYQGYSDTNIIVFKKNTLYESYIYICFMDPT